MSLKIFDFERRQGPKICNDNPSINPQQDEITCPAPASSHGVSASAAHGFESHNYAPKASTPKTFSCHKDQHFAALALLCRNTQCTAETTFDFQLTRLHPSILVETISNIQVPEAVLP